MTLHAVAFAVGAGLLQLQAELPGAWWALGLLPLLLFQKRMRAVPAFALAAGFLWAALLAHERMDGWLAPTLGSRDLQVVGVVASLPAYGERSVRFDFDVEQSLDGERLPRRIQLAWYRSGLAEEGAAPLAALVHPGERWRFTVRLRRPHGSANPHGFDYAAWLLERGIGATGYVRARGGSQRLGARNGILDRVEQAREAVRARFLSHLGATPAAGILTALAVGDQRAIAAEEWQLFARTGVTHLMSISGLHVTLVSGLFAWLVSALWRRTPALALRLPARKVAAVAAVAGALGYTLLAGFAVPAQRTLYMVAVVAVALWCGCTTSPLRVLALALALVVLLDPWAPLSPGLWLSFGAVLVIFYVGAGWSRPEPRAMQWGRVQWAITIGLAPAAVFLFGQVSVAGPLANAAAIPLVSGVVTPLALAAAVVPVDMLLDVAAWLVEWLLQFLEWCAALPAAVWVQHAPGAGALLLALAGVAWLLAPPGVPFRMAGLALLAPAFLLAPPRPAHGEAWITTLDVGQGLAVLVRTSAHTLLYDAGPAYGADADSGGRIVLPLLRASGIDRLDAMVLSHEDLDHLGGALTILESLPVDFVSSSLPRAHPLHSLPALARPCAAGQAWTWDGVRFEMHHPVRETSRRNDRSCVVRIATRGGAILLAGDIERGAEAELVARRAELRSDVLLMPHHGSRTSSSAALLEAVAPRSGIAAAGYRNRFGHPSAEVVERYRAAGARVLRTDLDGAVHVLLGTSTVGVEPERDRSRRYWRAVPRV